MKIFDILVCLITDYIENYSEFVDNGPWVHEAEHLDFSDTHNLAMCLNALDGASLDELKTMLKDDGGRIEVLINA